MCRRLIFTFLVLIVLVLQESNASPIRNFRKLLEAESPGGQPMQLAPQPSPAPSNGSDSSGLAPGNSGGESRRNNDTTKMKLIDVITDERCEISSSVKCHNVEKNMTACLMYAKSGPRESFLVVQNDGETSLEIRLTTFPQNITYDAIELQKHLAMKINMSTIVGGTGSIAVNAGGNGDCEIQLESSPAAASEDKTNQTIPPPPPPSNTSSIQSVPSGAYLVVLVIVVGGGAWAFVKVRGSGRHLEGVLYQELEMGPHSESLSAVNVETVEEGWDKDWDDDWDEENAVRTPGKKQTRNDFADSNDSDDGWEHDQDD